MALMAGRAERDMMSTIFEKFDTKLRPANFVRPLFYNHDYALRFELNGEDVSAEYPIRRFTQAHARAVRISKAAFAKSARLWFLTAAFGGEKPHNKHLKPFREVGIRKRHFEYLGAVKCPDDPDFSDEITHCHWHAKEIWDRCHLDEVLWLALGAELGIRPTYHGALFVVDFDRNIVLFPYDDRGMDLVALERAPLEHVYHAHSDWLFEWNREEIDAVFLR
jgi:hypothetical protein